MELRSRNLFHLFWIVLFWRFCKIRAYVDVCESSHGTVYCDCEELAYGQPLPLHRASCVIFPTATLHDPIWRSIGDSDNIANLKLHPWMDHKQEYIPSDDLRRMANLKYLKIEQFTLGTLKSYSLSEFQNLQELELEGNEITSLEPNAISNMPALKKLILSENSLVEFLADTLTGLDVLEVLFLDRNKISRIETCAFCNLQNLKDLELWGNLITDLTEYTFRGLRYVKRLDLARNRIRVLSNKVFHTMPLLMELDLRENVISYIAPQAFVGLEKLQTLSLGKNDIKVLPNEVFAPLLNTRMVDLYGNELAIIQREVVEGMNKSKDEFFSIRFNGNPLRCDCAWQWISTYLKLNKSHALTRELQEVKCQLDKSNSDNETEQIIVEYLQTVDCKTSTIKPRTPAAIPNIIVMSTNSVPIELSIHKSNRKVENSNNPVADDGTEAYLSDVEDKDDSGANSLKFHISFGLYLSLIILYLTRSQL